MKWLLMTYSYIHNTSLSHWQRSCFLLQIGINKDPQEEGVQSERLWRTSLLHEKFSPNSSPQGSVIDQVSLLNTMWLLSPTSIMAACISGHNLPDMPILYHSESCAQSDHWCLFSHSYLFNTFQYCLYPAGSLKRKKGFCSFILPHLW